MMTVNDFEARRSRLTILILLVLVAPLLGAPVPETRILQEQKAPSIAELVAAYEARPEKRGEDARALAPIAEAVLRDARKQTDPAVLVPACISRHSDGDKGCHEKLGAIAGSARAPVRPRVAAAVHLINARLAEGTSIEAVVKGAPDTQLAAVADQIASIPPEAAVPVLRRLLLSSSGPVQTAAARALSGISAPGVVEALDDLQHRSLPGSPPWAAALSARARLGRAEALGILPGAQGNMPPDERVDAGRVLIESGDDRGVAILMMITRTETGLRQLRAAELLMGRRDDILVTITTDALDSADPAVRAEALKILTNARQPLPTGIARFFLDTDRQVRIRAAESVLDALDRRQ